MAGQDYVPLGLPGDQWSCVAGAAITAGQLVYVSAGTLIAGAPGYVGGTPNSGNVNPTVTPTTAATAALVGVAANSAASGGWVSVYFRFAHVLTASGAIAAGAPVIAATGGAVADGTADATYSQIIGHALSAASNNLVAVKLRG